MKGTKLLTIPFTFTPSLLGSKVDGKNIYANNSRHKFEGLLHHAFRISGRDGVFFLYSIPERKETEGENFTAYSGLARINDMTSLAWNTEAQWVWFTGEEKSFGEWLSNPDNFEPETSYTFDGHEIETVTQLELESIGASNILISFK